MEALHSGFLVWHPALPTVWNYRRRNALCFSSINVAPNKGVFAFPDCLLNHSISTFVNRRRLSVIRNPNFRVLRAASPYGYIGGEFRGINDEFADVKLDAGNGAVAKDYKEEFFQRVRRILALILSFLPGGSWWKVGDAVENESRIKGPSLICTLRRIWALIAPDKFVIIGAFTALIIAAISEISIPHFVAATIFSAQSGSKVYFYRNAQLLALMCCTFGLFSGIRGGCFGVANQFLVQRMREKLFLVLLCQDIAFFDMEAVGVLTSRLGLDCEQVSHIIGNDFNKIFRNGLQGIGALIYLVMLSWQLALSTVLLCCLMSTILFLYGRYQKNMAKYNQEVVASANEVAQETLSLARIVRTFGTEKQECERYSKWLKKLVDINLRQNVAYGLCTWSSNTFYNATQVVALLIGGGFVMNGHITAEQLTKFILYSEWVIHSAWWVGDHWASLMQSIGASEKVFELMELPLSKQLTSQGLRLPELEGQIKFLDVSFNYPARPMVPVLQNVNLSIASGELVALVGLSGSGKSTLVNLLLRLYEPESGQILVDGIPLNELDVMWLRSKIGVVSQEPRLFSMDIASNISYGCTRKVSHNDIEWAAKQAHAHEFIVSLPDGYKTLVDNARLSGGQKQRISIARAILRKPTVLVLDEATSALDAESENYIKKAIERIMHNDGKRKRTVLVIAHRLSTIRAADRIVVMENGRIVEMGSHDELLKNNGKYAKLTSRQISSIT